MAVNDNDINICSRALNAIGASSISSFEEGTVEAQVAKQKYTTCKEKLLSIYPWTFNKSECYLARINNNPLAKYKYIYERPTDCLTVRTIKENGYIVEYCFLNGKINTDAENPSIVYSSNTSESYMPTQFISLLIDMLARDFLIPVTGQHGDYNSFDKIYQNSFIEAKNVDAMSKTPSCIDSSLLVGLR